MTKLAPGVEAKTVEAMIATEIPLGRVGTKHDIAMAAVFLSSGGAGFISYVCQPAPALIVRGGRETLCARDERVWKRLTMAMAMVMASRGDTLVVDGGSWMYRAPPVPREMVSQLSRSVENRSRNVGGASAAVASPPNSVVAKL